MPNSCLYLLIYYTYFARLCNDNVDESEANDRISYHYLGDYAHLLAYLNLEFEGTEDRKQPYKPDMSFFEIKICYYTSDLQPCLKP